MLPGCGGKAGFAVPAVPRGRHPHGRHRRCRRPPRRQARRRGGGMGKPRFLVSRRQRKRAGAAARVPDLSPESRRGRSLSRSVTAIPKPGPGGREPGGAAGIYPGDGSRRNVPLAGRDGREDTAPCPCRRRVPWLRSCRRRAPSRGQVGHGGAAVPVVGGTGGTGSGSASPCLPSKASGCVSSRLELSVSFVPRICQGRWRQMPRRGGWRERRAVGPSVSAPFHPFLRRFCHLQSCPAIPACLPWLAALA